MSFRVSEPIETTLNLTEEEGNDTMFDKSQAVSALVAAGFPGDALKLLSDATLQAVHEEVMAGKPAAGSPWAGTPAPK